MADAGDKAAVSLSRLLASETPRHPAPSRDSGKTFAETFDLKELI
jgi:hypothetical protein